MAYESEVDFYKLLYITSYRTTIYLYTTHAHFMKIDMCVKQ